ncbi:MgtC/SapB family protein [Lonepinella sp. MS14437]|uniref:MgtC/SapB family protein n=1 Tax=unclassified Lonepinella TaxID=2642006 RepID=UPI0036D83BDF
MENIQTLFLAVVTSSHFIILMKLCVAMCLGGIIGLERELKRKPVGVKTCVIISITTCILTIVSIQSAEYYAEVSQNIRTDPMRLAAQVISGIGFLGAGVILRKSNDAISGLTTAAIVWAAAGIGIAAGAGFFFDAILATLMIFIAIRLSPIVQHYIQRHRPADIKATLTVHLNDMAGINKINALFAQHHCDIEDMNIKDLYHGEIKLVMCADLENKDILHHLYGEIKLIPEVLGVDLESK